MSNVGATQASASAPASAGVSQAPTGTIVGVSGAPAAPPVGTVLNGVIAVQQPGGLVEIRLDNGGTIQVRTAFPLPANGQIALNVTAPGPPAQFVLLSVNDHPVGRGALRPAVPAPASATAEGGQAGAAAERPAATLPPLVQGRVAMATVARIDAPMPGVSQGSAAAPAGSTAQPAASAMPTAAASIAMPGIATSAPGAAPGAAAAAAALAPGRLAVGAQLAVRVLALGGAPPLAAEAGRVVLSGTVGPTTPGGQTTVNTPFGILTLAAGPSPALGSAITLELIGPARTAAAPPQALSLPPGPAALSQEWTALREAIQALGQTNAVVAQAVLDIVVPQPGPKLAASMLFLVAALRGGNVRGWLGDAASRALERGGAERLLRRLSGDFTALQRLAHDGTGEWRAFFFPIYDGAFHQLRLFVHNHANSDLGDEAEDPGERFVVEVDLSRLGALQLDGLIRKRRFDLILRSRTPLSEAMHDDITRIFTSAAEAGGLAGHIVFQALPAFPVAPIKELPVAATEVVV